MASLDADTLVFGVICKWFCIQYFYFHSFCIKCAYDDCIKACKHFYIRFCLFSGSIFSQGASVEFLILMGDNLSSLFPNVCVSLLGVHLVANKLFAIVAALAVLPTAWLRNLMFLSYVSGWPFPNSELTALCVVLAQALCCRFLMKYIRLIIH